MQSLSLVWKSSSRKKYDREVSQALGAEGDAVVKYRAVSAGEIEDSSADVRLDV